ncbi:MAG: MarR family transcriptional regulator [Cellvibrionales bacterium]|nr:MarR family transcriptional regulator [Cellvibrionales bacterium]|tara:strand:- start:137 stop:574 length:438 start_codon:yes stop_codon:yes gene_type:complete
MNKLPPFDLAGFSPYRLTVAAQKLSDVFARQYRDQFGISNPEWRVLVHLSQSDGTSVRDIEARVAMEKSKVSRAAKRLEQAGYISKQINKTDRRLLHLHLTAEGQSLMTELLPLANRFQQEMETRLGKAFAGLEAGLDKILEDQE